MCVSVCLSGRFQLQLNYIHNIMSDVRIVQAIIHLSGARPNERMRENVRRPAHIQNNFCELILDQINQKSERKWIRILECLALCFSFGCGNLNCIHLHTHTYTHTI